MNENFYVSDEVHKKFMEEIEQIKKKLNGRKLVFDESLLKSNLSSL